MPHACQNKNKKKKRKEKEKQQTIREERTEPGCPTLLMMISTKKFRQVPIADNEGLVLT